MKFYGALFFAATTLAFIVMPIFAQCGADGTQPCGTAPKKTNTTTVTKKAVKSKSDAVTSKPTKAAAVRKKSANSAKPESAVKLDEPVKTEPSTFPFGVWRFERCTDNEIVPLGVVENNEVIMEFEFFNIKSDNVVTAYRSDKWIEFQLRKYNLKWDKTTTLELKSGDAGWAFTYYYKGRLPANAVISQPDRMKIDQGFGVSCFYRYSRQ